MRWFNKNRVPLFAALLTGAMILGLLLVNILPLLRWSIFSEWLVSFLPFVILYSLPVMFLLFLLKMRWQWWAPLGLLVIWNSINCFPYFIPNKATTLSDATIKIYAANVWQINKQHERLIEQIKKNQPDFVFLQEVDPSWVEDVEAALSSDYPYRKAHPATNMFGLMVLSKIPIKNFQKHEIEHRSMPFYELELRYKEKDYHILAMHTLPPTRPGMLQIRNQQLKKLEKYTKKNSVVMGDFNTSVYSPYFKQLLQNTGLQNPRGSAGFLHSWPAEFPFLGSNLDHILVGKSVQFGKLRRMPPIGSDHLPLQLEIK